MKNKNVKCMAAVAIISAVINSSALAGPVPVRELSRPARAAQEAKADRVSVALQKSTPVANSRMASTPEVHKPQLFYIPFGHGTTVVWH
jgi:hypothetical protein